MDRTIVERAVRALAAVNTGRGIETRFAPASVRAAVRKVEGGEIAACDSPCCGGCYKVAPGVWIHPPKCGEDYRVWLERWEARGRLQ